MAWKEKIWVEKIMCDWQAQSTSIIKSYIRDAGGQFPAYDPSVLTYDIYHKLSRDKWEYCLCQAAGAFCILLQ